MNLKEYCTADTVDLFDTLARTLPTKEGYEACYKNRYIYFDRGEESKTLFVAHLDTVADLSYLRKTAPRRVGFTMENHPRFGQVATSLALDDRLGVWIGLELLAERGILCDVLLTIDEESGNSTAQNFTTDKQYNWMFQFDRHGVDPVLYQYDTREMRDRLESVGFSVTFGTFSDICSLGSLGVSGINFGVGYQHEHSDKCHAFMTDVLFCVDTFEKFWNKYKDTSMPYVPKYSNRRGGYRLYSDDGLDDAIDWSGMSNSRFVFETGSDDGNPGICIMCGLQSIELKSGCCENCRMYLDALDEEGEEWEDEYSTLRTYQAYCDVCNCDLVLTREEAQASILLCKDCAKKFQEHGV